MIMEKDKNKNKKEETTSVLIINETKKSQYINLKNQINKIQCIIKQFLFHFQTT